MISLSKYAEQVRAKRPEGSKGCSYTYRKEIVKSKILCKYCGNSITTTTKEIDILSRWEGKRDAPTIYLVCDSCNARKAALNNKLLELADEMSSVFGINKNQKMIIFSYLERAIELKKKYWRD